MLPPKMQSRWIHSKPTFDFLVKLAKMFLPDLSSQFVSRAHLAVATHSLRSPALAYVVSNPQPVV